MGTGTSRVGHADRTSPSLSSSSSSLVLPSEERQLSVTPSTCSSSSWPCANCHATCSGTGPCPRCHGMQAPVHVMATQLRPRDVLANTIITMAGTPSSSSSPTINDNNNQEPGKLAESDEPAAADAQESTTNRCETSLGIMEQTDVATISRQWNNSNSKAGRIAQQLQVAHDDDFRPVDPVGLTLAAAVPSPINLGIQEEDHKRKRDLWFSAIHRTSSPTTFITQHLTTPNAPRKKRILGVLSE